MLGRIFKELFMEGIMKLVYLWVYKYNGGYLDKIGFHFSNELVVKVDYISSTLKKESTIFGEKEVEEVFVKVELKRSNDAPIPKSLYGESILGMTAVVGKNGAGKTSLLQAIMQSDNLQPDLSGDKEPFLAIYYDEENSKFLIDKLYVNIENIIHDDDISVIEKINKRIIYKCYVTNVFNWTELGRGREELIKNGMLSKCGISPAGLMKSSAETERKSYGYRTDDNNYLVNIQNYAEKEIQSEIQSYAREQQRLFLQFARRAPEKHRKEVTILREYQIGLREFREDITNIEYYYNHGENKMALPNNNFELLSAYEQAQVETKLYYGILSYKLFQRKDDITLWDEIYVLLLAEVYLSFCGSNGEFYRYLQKEFINMKEVHIDEGLLENIRKELSDSEISRTPWCKQIFEAIEELKNREKRNWKLNTTYQFAEEREDGFIKWFSNKLTDKNSFFTRNLCILPQAGSSGEEGFVNLFAYIEEAVAKLNIKGILLGTKVDVVLLIDEIDCYFHPVWQKKAIQFLLDWLNELYKYCRFQIVVTSHSPIILSDFMREQVIKLTVENNKCAIQQDDEETFGANIAKLYYDTFFMNNGQIGEFAKSRISEAIDFVHASDKSYTPEYIKDLQKVKYIIAHIGDEFMQRKLGMELIMKDDQIKEMINNYLQTQQESEQVSFEEESEPEL